MLLVARVESSTSGFLVFVFCSLVVSVCNSVSVSAAGSGFVLAAARAAVSQNNPPAASARAQAVNQKSDETEATVTATPGPGPGLTGPGDLNSEPSDFASQSREAAYFMPTGISALGALIFLKIKAVLVVLVAVLIIGILSKVAAGVGGSGGYGIACGGGPMCPQLPHSSLPHSADYPPSAGHTAYREDYFPHYEPTATGPYSRSSPESEGIVSRMLNTVNVVDLGFAVLDIPSDECRRRLVCEIDNSAARHPPLSFLINTFRENLSKYRDESSANDGTRNCMKLYPHCDMWFPFMNASIPG